MRVTKAVWWKMTQFELNRYLDYASEMLAIMGKVAALWAPTQTTALQNLWSLG